MGLSVPGDGRGPAGQAGACPDYPSQRPHLLRQNHASRILSDGLSQDGSRSGRISLDDFYKNRDQAPLWEDGSKNFESIEGLDLEAFGSCLDTLFTTGRAQVPIFDFTTGTRSPLTQELTFDDDTCLIFEGLHAINPRLTPLLGK